MTTPAVAGGHGPQAELDAKAVDRLVFFSDAVIAIIITLMVLEVRLPPLPEHASDADVRDALVALWPKYVAVVLSFLVIGLFWTLHHRRFNRVRHVDAGLVWLNLLFLLALACLPFASAIVAEHGGRTPTILYASIMCAASFITMLLWRSVSGQPEIAADPAAYRELRIAVLMSLISVCFFLGSIAVAFFSPTLAQACWFLVFIANRTAQEVYMRRHRPVSGA